MGTEPRSSEDVFVADALSDAARQVLAAGTSGAPGSDHEGQLSRGAARPLTRAERAAARNEPGVPKRVYAPASVRIPKHPLPADERFFPPDAAGSLSQVRTRNRSITPTSRVTETVHVFCELVLRKTPA